MEDIQAIVNGIYQKFYERAQAEGITFSGFDHDSGVFYIPTYDGATAQISLHNLIEYYLDSRDGNAVEDFVRKIKDAVGRHRDPTWAEARENIYLSPCHHETIMDNPYGRQVTGYFYTIPVVDTPDASIRIVPELAEKWGTAEEDLHRLALENGTRLLAATPLEIGDVQGHPLGSFRTEDRNLTGACLFAPGLKEKIIKDFGWPIYFIFPDKITCHFFGRDHYDFFEPRIGKLIAEKYDGGRRISPELMEFSDGGVKSIRSWAKHGDCIISFDESEE